jgi:hypothetical protein
LSTEEVPARDSIFAARFRFWLLSGLLGGLVVGFVAIYLVTQTRWGHEQVLGITLRTVSQQLDGTLEIRRLDGNLLTGARLYGLSLRGPDDEPFVIADSAFVEYSFRSLGGDEIVIDRIVLFDADVFIRQMPGDTLWNYDRIFGDTIPGVEPTEPRRPLVIRSATVASGNITVEMPWEPDPALAPAERARQVAEALSDRSNIIVREAPGGYLRTMRFDDVDVDLSSVVTAPDELGGTSLTVDDFSGLVRIFREPLDVRRLAGALSMQDGLMRFNVPVVELPDSRLGARGRIEFGHQEGPRLDITVHGEHVTFADLRPIYGRFPEEGGGSLVLIVETRPGDELLVLAREVDVRAPGTRLLGSFGVILGDAVRFVEVDLAADPLRVSTVEGMLPMEIPVVGLQIGGVEIRQPAS